MEPSGHAPRCVLCLTCANSLGWREPAERRGFPRTCGAGLTLGPDLFECPSYVRRTGADARARVRPQPGKDAAG